MKTPTSPNPLLMTEKEAAKILGFSARTLQKWRMNGNGPKFVHASSRAIRYSHCELERWIEDRMRTSTSDTGGSA
ncbi:MAG: helix-turn-helix domain-containing protein [bacterium]|nr:helix-turn-helix domain-containing protein [bacterium]